MKLPNSLQPTLIAIGILILFNCASLERDYNDRVDYYQNRNYYNQSYPDSQYPYDSGYREIMDMEEATGNQCPGQ
ncbi:MAG: hypothetical protein IPG24_21635 [Leptospiraceae bacterium]|nr:hypothetical protein [Leptospiraceae bacterium]